MLKLNQKGIAQVIILIVLLIGLAIGLYAVQKARTVIKPKADEGNVLQIVEANGDQVSSSEINIKITLPSGYDRNSLIKLYVENKDDGERGHEPFETSDFETYLDKPFYWKLNNLKLGDNEADRVIQLTLFDGTNYVPFVKTIKFKLTETHITSCQKITSPGNYILDQDLTATSATRCIDIYDVDNVNLHCNNHTITLILSDNDYNFGRIRSIINIKNVNGFSIDSCKVITPTNIAEFPIIDTLYITNSNDGKITNNVVGPHYSGIFESTNIQIIKNQFNDYFNVVSSKNILFDDNNLKQPFTAKGRVEIGAVISVGGGGSHTFNKNIIDGGSDGIFSSDKIGADDGISISDSEGGDIITDNTISNNWDCAIEISDLAKSMKITGNTLINSGICGIGGWFYASWIENVVSDNVIDNAPLMFKIVRLRGLKSDEKEVYFKDNTFNNNKFINPRKNPNGIYGFSSYINMLPSDGIPAEKFVLGNNKMTDNDFGPSYFAPYLQPGSMFIDGGGNKCGKSEFSDFPLKCN